MGSNRPTYSSTVTVYYEFQFVENGVSWFAAATFPIDHVITP